MATPGFLRAVEASLVTYRSTWRGSIVSSFLNPVLFLAAMGLGLGSLVDETGRGQTLAGGTYLAFLGPGLLAAAAMQTGAGEASYPIMAGIKWTKTYHAAMATPVAVRDIALGALTWVSIRVAITAVAFTTVLVLFGAAESAAIVLAVPAAVLVGAAHAAAMAAFVASAQNEYGLSSVFRFAIMPMFLFSGTFFPVDQLPSWLRPVAWATPLWHGVELCRSLALGIGSVAGNLGHVAYLCLWIAAGTVLTVRRFERRLVV
ncbi:MAG TPA: ABC transporter permease [Acidimicrobiales bacterium]|jgi:lipooligosaccharide transport system permease protein